MGGKTVALKMVGLFVAMTYCGMQIPASLGTRDRPLRPRDRRHRRRAVDRREHLDVLGAPGAHARNARRAPNARTLALVDEIGGGTEPAAGAALAIAMLERLLGRGARAVVVTTHATELKLFAHATPGVANASVRFDPHTFAPTFQLDVGAPGQSLAFPLAARARHRRDAIVERAQALLDVARARLRVGAGRAFAAQRRAASRTRRACARRARGRRARARTLRARARRRLEAERRTLRRARRGAHAAALARFRARAGATGAKRRRRAGRG